MQVGEGNIYGLFAPTLFWMVITIGLVVAAVASYYAYRLFKRSVALKAQDRVARPQKANAGLIISTALAKIEEHYNKAHVGDITVSEAGELVSAVSREAFDALMNHRTRFSSRFETRARNLEVIAVAQDIAYPIEFEQTPKDITELRSYCDKSKEIVSSCA